MQKYYGSAIRNNIGDVDSMVRATKAILYHSSQLYGLAHQQAVDRVKDGRHDNIHFYDHDSCPSSEEQRHQFCPIGMESWCKWQKDKAAGTKTYDPDKARIPHAIFHAVHDIIDSLSNRELLEQWYGEGWCNFLE